jgi:competence protein ComEA
MPHLVPGWRRLGLLLLPVLLGAAGLTAVLTLAPPAPTPAVAPAAAALPALPPPAGLLVHVSGAVLKPGLYRLQRGDRVYSAIAAAGGLAPGADSTRLPDLAGRLRDGEQVILGRSPASPSSPPSLA